VRFLVQKFGGTSLVTPELRDRLADKVRDAKEGGFTPVVVVSAMGRKGDPYATDTLLSLVAAEARDVPPREQDLLISCGEIISGVVVAAALRRRAIPAAFLTGGQAGIVTDANHTDARILRVDPTRIYDVTREGRVPVIAGFQGISEAGEITTLGRGGSDTTAAAIAVALNAESVDIYTDVEGVMAADPQIVTDARPLEVVTYNELCQLAHEGARVVHPRAVEIAMQKNIPLRVRSILSDAPGTLVTNHAAVYPGAIDITRDKIITGITYVCDITQFRIDRPDTMTSSEAHLKVFKGLALAGISVDLINVQPEAMLFTVKDEVAAKARAVLVNLGFEPAVRPGCAKIAAVGGGMTGVPGVMAGIVEALTKEDITILQSADSHTTIWVLVKQDDMERAIKALYAHFKLGE